MAGAIAHGTCPCSMEQFFAELTEDRVPSAKEWLLTQLCSCLDDRASLGAGTLVLRGVELPPELATETLESFAQLVGFEAEGMLESRLKSLLRGAASLESRVELAELALLVQVAHPRSLLVPLISHVSLFSWDEPLPSVSSEALWGIIRLVGSLHEAVSLARRTRNWPAADCLARRSTSAGS
jgi:hypothetical protein